MNEQALKLLYDEMSAQYDVGSFEDFKQYLSDDNQRSAFFEEAIKPNYDVESLDEFDSAYGLKKKKILSPTIQNRNPNWTKIFRVYPSLNSSQTQLGEV